MFYFDQMLALALFAFVSSVTPGPNNVMLLASGVNFGMRRTVPHGLGISLGFGLMVGLLGLGLGAVFLKLTWLPNALKVVGLVYMLWLAWRIAGSGPVEGGESRGKPLTFLEAAAFQWVNPKGWMMGLSAVSAYSVAEEPLSNALLVALIFAVVNLPCVSVWALFGSAMRRFLSDPRTARVFNITMALLLVLSIWPIAADLFILVFPFK